MRPERDRLDGLLARLIEETITDMESRELEGLLETRSEARDRYLDYLGLHADLERAVGGATPVRPDTRRRTRAPFGLAWVAALLLLLGAVFIWPRGEAPFAEILAQDGAVRWAGADGRVVDAPKAGMKLGAGTLEVLGPDAHAELELFDGTTLSLSGRSSLGIRKVNRQTVLDLRRGDLSLQVVSQPREAPLRLTTPSAEVDVLGTQFNVVADSFSTQLTVNEGRVRVKRRSDGQVQEVHEGQRVVAALEHRTNFQAEPLLDFTEHWVSRLPSGLSQGDWWPGENGAPGRARAETHLWEGHPGEPVKPVLLHSVVVRPSPKGEPPFRLAGDTRLRIRGRLDRAARIHVGFATRFAHGGFSGRYATEIPGTETSSPSFELDLPLDAFERNRNRFPRSPVGHEVAYIWIQTVVEDAGLAIESMELAGGETTSN